MRYVSIMRVPSSIVNMQLLGSAAFVGSSLNALSLHAFHSASWLVSFRTNLATVSGFKHK